MQQNLVQWESLKTALLICYDAPVPDEGRGIREMSMPAAWLVERGWAEVSLENRPPLRAGPGQWLMAPDGRRLQNFSSNARILSLSFRAAFASGEQLFSTGLPRVLSAEEFPELEANARKLLHLCKTSLNPGNTITLLRLNISLTSYLRLQAALLDWVRAWADALIACGLVPAPGRASDPRVVQAIEFFSGNLGSCVMDTARLTRQTGLSISQLNRLFLKQMGETLQQNFQQQRLTYAKTLLLDPRRNIKDAAMELGFRHQSHFTTWFRNKTRMTPSVYRTKAMPPPPARP